MTSRALCLSLKDNGPDEATPGVQVSWAGWNFPGMPNLLDILGPKGFHRSKGWGEGKGKGRQEVLRDRHQGRILSLYLGSGGTQSLSPTMPSNIAC